MDPLIVKYEGIIQRYKRNIKGIKHSQCCEIIKKRAIIANKNEISRLKGLIELLDFINKTGKMPSSCVIPKRK